MSNAQEFLDLMSEVNGKLSYYVIEPATRAMGEDGQYVDGDGKTVGYAVINKLTGVRELTSTMLPGVIWQAQHFDSTLRSLLEAEETPETVLQQPSDDVMIN